MAALAADSDGEVLGRRRKSARNRREQALRAEARRLRRAQAMGAAMVTFFLKGLECGLSYAVVFLCRKIVSPLCLFLALPFLVWLFRFLLRRFLMVTTPSWWRLFCFTPCVFEKLKWKI